MATLRRIAGRIARRRSKGGSAWRLKWLLDRRQLPLQKAHEALYAEIHRYSFRKRHRYPRLVHPGDYTDKIQWLMLFDQDEQVIRAVDKITGKDMVAERVGDDCAPRTLQVARSFDGLRLDELPASFVIKTNHDSGGVFIVRHKASLDVDRVRGQVDRALSETYGWHRGEWPYAFIEPKVFAEEFLGAPDRELPADYKFHCVEGTVAWFQQITGREREPRESVADRAGRPLDVRFSAHFESAPYRKPRHWDRMVSLAERMAQGFKYVRIDLYDVDGRLYVGELTFFPSGGWCYGPSQRIFGHMLDFDRSRTKPPLVGPLPGGGTAGAASGSTGRRHDRNA